MILFLAIVSVLAFVIGVVLMGLGHPAFPLWLLAGVGLFVFTLAVDVL